MIQETVKLRHLRQAPRKVRLVADLVRGLSVQKAEAELGFSKQRAALAVRKLLLSALANIKEKNAKVNLAQFKIQAIKVDEGAMLKRHLPRARGMATLIQKKSSHLTLTLVEDASIKETFKIIKKAKKVAKETKKEVKPAADKAVQEKEIKTTKDKKPEVKKDNKPEAATKDKGLFKKMFRRKSV